MCQKFNPALHSSPFMEILLIFKSLCAIYFLQSSFSVKIVPNVFQPSFSLFKNYIFHLFFLKKSLNLKLPIFTFDNLRLSDTVVVDKNISPFKRKIFSFRKPKAVCWIKLMGECVLPSTHFNQSRIQFQLLTSKQ